MARETVIKVENISKKYRLGVMGGRRLGDDLGKFWKRLRN